MGWFSRSNPPPRSIGDPPSVRPEAASPAVVAQPTPHNCSFCGKSQREVRKLNAGPNVCICDECTLFVAATVRLDPIPPRATERDLRGALAAAGLIPELLARFDRVIPLPRPDADALLGILEQPQGPLAEARRVVDALGGTLDYSRAALRALAEAAAADGEGAWSLRHVVERQLEEILTAPAAARPWPVDEVHMRALIAEVMGAARA